MNQNSRGENYLWKVTIRWLDQLRTAWTGDERRQILRSLGRWWLTIVLMVGILLASGQAALLRPMSVAAADTNSRLSADYSPWQPLVFAPLTEGVLADILGETHQNQYELIFQGDYWPGEVAVRPPALPTATLETTAEATAVAMAVNTATSTPERMQVTPSLPAGPYPPPVTTSAPRLYPTATRVKSSTPTRTVRPPATITRTPTRTNTLVPSRTPTRTPSLTLSPSHTQAVPSITLTPSRTPTHTLVASLTPSMTSSITLSATPSATPTLVTPTPTGTNTPTLDLTSAGNRIPTSTPSPTPTSSHTPTPTVTDTPTPSATATATDTPTPTDTPTDTPTSTATDTPTPTYTETSTSTFTDTPTSTATDTPTPTHTDTPTSTFTDTPTSTPTQIPLPPEIEIGPPDGDALDLGCGNSLIVDLGQQTWIGTLVFYEYFNPFGCGGGICLDWISIDVSPADTVPWTQVFYWGDTDDSNNGSVPPSHFPPEDDNEFVLPFELYNITGILIDVSDTHRYIRFTAPSPCGDPAQIDAIEILP